MIGVCMAINVGSNFPKFSLGSTQGQIDYERWNKGSWTLFLTHPEDLTKFNLVKNGVLQGIINKLNEKNVNIIGFSELTYVRWANYVDQDRLGLNFPVIPDINSHKFPYYEELKSSEFGGATRLIALADSNKQIRFFSTYPVHAERHFHSIIEYLDHLKYSDESPLSRTKSISNHHEENSYQSILKAA